MGPWFHASLQRLCPPVRIGPAGAAAPNLRNGRVILRKNQETHRNLVFCFKTVHGIQANVGTQMVPMETLADAIPTAATGPKASPTQHAFIRALVLSQQPAEYASLCIVVAEENPPPYGKTRCPVLIIAGQDDKTTPLSSSQTIMESCDNADGFKTLQLLHGVGYWPRIEAPSEAAALVKGFIRREFAEI